MEFDVLGSLRDGKILCQLANSIKPGAIPEIYSDSPFGTLENLTMFLKVCRTDLKLSLLFCEADLLHMADPTKVIDTLHDLARAAHVLNPSIPTLREKLPDSKYSKWQVNVAVEYTLNKMARSSESDPLVIR